MFKADDLKWCTPKTSDGGRSPYCFRCIVLRSLRTVHRWVLKIHSICLGMDDLSTYLDIFHLVPKRRQEMTRCSQNDIMEHFCSLNRNAFASETLPISSIYIIETNKISIPSYVCYVSLHLPCKSTINVCECNFRPMDGMDGCKKLQVKIAFDPFGSITSWELTQQLGVCWKSSCYFLVEKLFQLKFVKFFFVCLFSWRHFPSVFLPIFFSGVFSCWEFFQVKFVKLFIHLVWGRCLFWNNRWINLTY